MSVTTVLLSGGMDSMACVHVVKAAGAEARGLYIDYNQTSARREEAAARQVAAYFGIRAMWCASPACGRSWRRTGSSWGATWVSCSWR